MSLNDLSGQTVGQYQLQRLLGVGGMGAVYEAYQPSLKRVVALKLLPDSLSRQSGYAARFTREAETAASLEHPHIVPIYDYGTADGISYVAMRLLSGGSLEERLEQQGALPLLVAARILKELANALDYAHSRGVIHRDIKPSNVMFDDHNNAFLVDFGIAKLLEATQGLTHTGATMGTPIFMSPEQWKAEVVSAASDQYAFGVLAYFLVTGKAPFEATTPFALMHKHINETPPAVHLVTENPLHSPVSPVINRAMAKLPEDRYPTMLDFAEAFERASQRENRMTDSGTVVVSTQSLPTLRRPPVLPWAVAAIATLLAIGFMVGMIIALVSDDDPSEVTVTADVRGLNTANAIITNQAVSFDRYEATIAAQNANATVVLGNVEATQAAQSSNIDGTLTAVQGDANATQAALQDENNVRATAFAATLVAVQTLSVDDSANVELLARVGELEAQVATQAADNDALQATSTAVAVEISDSQATAAVLQADFATLQANASAQEDQIATLTILAEATPAIDEPTTSALSATVNTPIGVYSSSSTTSRVLGLLNQGTIFEVTGRSSDSLWYQVVFVNAGGQDTEGYVESAAVVLTSGTSSQLPVFQRDTTAPTPSPTPTVAITVSATVSQQTAIYTEASISSRGLGLLSVGDTFTIEAVSPNGAWYRIAFENTGGLQTGYIESTNVVTFGDASSLPVMTE